MGNLGNVFVRNLVAAALMLAGAGGLIGEAEAVDLKTSVADTNDVFTADVVCRSVCKHGASKNVVRSAVFDPKAWGLKRGNGNLWGLLGMELWNWGQSLCASEALVRCGSAAKVESFKLEGLSSGPWSLKKAPGCPKKGVPEESIPSPYQFREKLRHEAVVEGFAVALDPFSGVVREPVSMVARDLPLAGGREMKASEKCKARIATEFCGGDCISGHCYSCETLSTDDPGTQRPVAVCGDDFVARIKELKRQGESVSALRLACETYFLASLRKNTQGGYSPLSGCASYRGEIRCDEVLRALGKGAALRDGGAEDSDTH